MIYNIKEELLLKVQTALVNACMCKGLLTSTSLVESHIIDIATGMDNKILGAMARKHARGSGDSALTPQKIATSPRPALLHQLCRPLRPKRVVVKNLARIPQECYPFYQPNFVTSIPRPKQLLGHIPKGICQGDGVQVCKRARGYDPYRDGRLHKKNCLLARYNSLLL